MGMRDINNAIMNFSESSIANLVQKELDSGADVMAVLTEGLIAPLDEIGKEFSRGNLFLPEMMMAAQCVKAGLSILRPRLAQSGTKPKATIVLGTVKGDLHDIGKNLVGMMLEGAGFQVIDLGADVDPGAFIAGVRAHNASIVGLSALLTTTMIAMEKTVSAFKNQEVKVKVIIGGAPVTQAFADKIGADGYGKDAPSAVDLVRRLTA